MAKRSNFRTRRRATRDRRNSSPTSPAVRGPLPPFLWGLSWTMTAVDEGLHEAAATPLPDGDEAMARHFARRFANSAEQRAFARTQADEKGVHALAAIRAAKLIMSAASPGGSLPEG